MAKNDISKETKTIASVIKAINVLNYISESKEDVGITEISNALNYKVSATYHLINTLKICGMITQNPETKRYKLGLRVQQLGRIANDQNNLSIILRKFLKKLKEITNETVNLTELYNNQIIYIAQEESDRLVKMFTKPGATAPLYCTGAGKIFLAYKSEEDRETILNSIDLIRFTPNTIVIREELDNELKKIRRMGYGFDNEEREIGVNCIGAPIFNSRNEVIACISISGPSMRFTKENKDIWVTHVINISKEASDFLANNFGI